MPVTPYLHDVCMLARARLCKQCRLECRECKKCRQCRQKCKQISASPTLRNFVSINTLLSKSARCK